MTTDNICLHHKIKTWHVLPVLQAEDEGSVLGEKSLQTRLKKIWDQEIAGKKSNFVLKSK